MSKRPFIYLFIAFLSMGCASNQKPDTVRTASSEIFDRANAQYQLMAKSLPQDQFPTTFYQSELKSTGSGWWCSGFYPGSLFYIFEQTNDSITLAEASKKLKILEKEKLNTSTHDLGFMIHCSFGNAYRLTKNEKYKEVIYEAAKSLASRFNPKVGCIRSWDPAPWNNQWQYPVIIDNMMNLEMLLWAAEAFNDTTLFRIAKTHANTTLKNHYRQDYSSYHVVSYDTLTGKVEAKNTDQGYADESAWARGQGWGLYGFTMMYRFTKDTTYLKHAVGIADYLIQHPNLPSDKVPYWDFDAPNIPNEMRDASAAAVISSALFELGDYTEKGKSEKYFQTAEKILNTLSSPAYLSETEESGGFLLKHCVGNMPDHTEVDVPLSYADYYFLEALSRYKKHQ